jgi:2-aminobenzoate-CoA ligase
MRDTYPNLASVDARKLVAPERQPEYSEPADLDLPANVNVARAILDAAPDDHVAVIGHDRGTQLTFAELRSASANLADILLTSGLELGERVAIRSGNRPEAVVAALAVWRAGGIVVPTPVHARAPDLKFLLDDTEAAMIIADASAPLFDDVPLAMEGTKVRSGIAFGCDEPPVAWGCWRIGDCAAAGRVTDVDTPGAMPAIIWHTGGTTGTPKACYHTHRRYLLGGYTFAKATGAGSGQRWLAAAPVGHALGFLSHSTFTLLHGATVVMVEDFATPATILRAIADHEVSTLTAIAATWSRLLDTLEAEPTLDCISSLRRAYAMWQSASSSAVYSGWLARGIELLNNFGSTAFANWVLVPQDTGVPTPQAALGPSTPGYDIRAIDLEAARFQSAPIGKVGRMAVRGPTGLTYWNRPAEQERDVVDGWTLVDDLIAFDGQGSASYHGRTDFVISSAGYKIAPIEVEVVLSTHPYVKEVGVVGTPDALRSEVVTAFVVLRDQQAVESQDALRKELQDYVKERIAPYKYPRRIEFIDALPRDPVGKILPRVLKEWGAQPASGSEVNSSEVKA